MDLDIEVERMAEQILACVVGSPPGRCTANELKLARYAASAMLRAENAEAGLRGQLDAEQCFG